jgi:hypothetical protein
VIVMTRIVDPPKAQVLTQRLAVRGWAYDRL